MRNPFRSEAEAFSFVLVCVALFAAVAVAGILAGGWVALVVFVVLAIGIALYVKGEPEPPAEPVRSRAGEGRRRILVVANETVAGRALRGEVVRRAGADADVLVVCPALNSQLRHWASDEDAARAEAERRLGESLAALASAGVEARGEVGDADPVQAMDDALQDVRRGRDRHLDAPAGPLQLAREGRPRAGAGALRDPDRPRGRRPRARAQGSAPAGAR